MTIWWLAVIVLAIVFSGLAFIWLVVRIGSLKPKQRDLKSLTADLHDAPEKDVETIFNDEFREELRNRGRLHFDKIISDSTAVLQQDLQLTNQQISEHMKTELTSKLQEEFTQYQQALSDARQQAVAAMQRTTTAIDQQRERTTDQLAKEAEAEKNQIIKSFEQNVTKIINQYLLVAIGDHLDLSDQLSNIIADLNANKQLIIEDLKNAS